MTSHGKSGGTARSRGALLFSRLGHTQAVLAKKLGVSLAVVGMWQLGERTPGLANRKLIQSRFAIAIESWDEAPARDEPPAKEPAPAAGWSKPTVASRARDLARIIDAGMGKLNTDETITDLERIKLGNGLAKSLAELRKLTGEQIPEPELLDQPCWISIRDTILDALQDEPNVLRRVLDAIETAERRA